MYYACHAMVRFLPALAGVALLAAAVAAAQPPAPKSEPPRPADAKAAVITLDNGGEIRIEFFPEDAPKTVQNFVRLARDGFYDATTFHRVEPGFVVQGGDPLSKTLPRGDPRIGTGDPGYKIKAEFSKRPHDRGVVAMARARDPDSAGSQFYITLAPAHFLDGKYTVFGHVVSGMDVVDTIRPGDRIKSIRVVR